ncbi:hypothetical protein YC2023_033731 [Brassica napus]
MDAFELRFKKGFSDWKRDYKKKYDSSRKKYIMIRMLTQNRTGLGYDWWKERERECPGIRKASCKEIDNMDMFEAEFGSVVVTGAEGWSGQHGEASLDSRVGGDIGEDEADSQPAAETQALETETQRQAPRQTQPAAQTHSGSSIAKRRRKEKDVAVEACEKRTAALEVKNMLAKQLMEREQPFSVETVLEMLYALPEVREWSPLYEASIELLIDSEGSRRGFITMKTDEAKTKFLELRTKIKRDE